MQQWKYTLAVWHVTSPQTVVAEDTDVTNPVFQLVFPVGHLIPTNCIDIPITSDTELEDKHEFTVEITGAGSAPHATLGMPVVTTVTIEDDESE